MNSAVLLFASLTAQLSARAQTPPSIMTWSQNTPDSNAALGVTSIGLGCSSTPNFCFTEIIPFASSQNVQQLDLAIRMDPNTSASYATQFGQRSLTNPVLSYHTVTKTWDGGVSSSIIAKNIQIPDAHPPFLSTYNMLLAKLL